MKNRSAQWITIPLFLLVAFVIVKYTGLAQNPKEPDFFWYLDGGALLGLLVGYLIDRRRNV